ncbi:MAG: HAMP domain-containing sensor histidine kinase [Candidatus Latescibacterota bacterium]
MTGPSDSRSDFEVRRQLLQMEMLYEIGLAISESLDPTHVGQEILQRELVDLGTLLRDSVDATQALWRERAGAEAPAVDWKLDLQAVPATWANGADLKDVFGNLLLNALEAMPRGGTLGVTCAPEAGHLCVRIRDTGVGMTEEVRQRALQPFYSTKGDAGTGLGLSIVYRIVDDHGGEVELDSTRGQGTCVLVRLPVKEGPPARG